MDLRPRFPAILPAALRDAISDLWRRNPARRPGWGEVGDLTRGALEAGAPPAAALDKRGSDIFEARRCGVLDSDSRLFESEAPPLPQDLLPKHVVQRMRAGLQAEPEHFGAVTILFCDVCGFTARRTGAVHPRSAGPLSPGETLKPLNP